MLISDIMARALDFIPSSATIQEAAVLMGELDVGALPVGSPEDLQGMITDRDILFRVVAEGKDNTAVRVRDVMSTTVFTCRETDTVEAAMDIMGSYHVRRLPVVNEAGEVTGMLTLSDLSRTLMLETGAMQNALAELSSTAKGD
ncbi:CBS domain-containing protein [Azospirillum sp. SYSU D00513]|uniref:CBS domain-containing protein n=1 Tax=Azospirillum sp. SYSU D00513 TaxID=2812561 RepID=UPI001FFFF6C6|nr:CBS domain-containing protein [Azospirillum sp. SYSU D00513]